ncbi:hypothetical protein PIIN_11544 [Serendipita indica DSM 11827]|uniref:Uncharacterized protein n=1 Tax=Serendipita indica (strain DSM 11827) TaxID=1109443 RepID=G4U1X4_SERID|nr:hypothetical protein PIIN_11544 [Serendipita indica DSM 11827]
MSEQVGVVIKVCNTVLPAHFCKLSFKSEIPTEAETGSISLITDGGRCHDPRSEDV